MSIRIDYLEHFSVLASERGMTKAARKLHMAQPTLSRQIASLEEEYGCPLYENKDGGLALTREGAILLNFAQSIIDLEQRAREEMGNAHEEIAGTVYLGYGDANAYRTLERAMRQVRDRYPGVRFHLASGDTNDLIELVNRGTLDFMLECDVRARKRYNSLVLPERDTWAVLVNETSPLYGKEAVKASDLEDLSIAISSQAFNGRALREWAGESLAKTNIAYTFNLGIMPALNQGGTADASFVYREVLEPFCGSGQRCIPLDPPIYENQGIIWRKDRQLSPAATAFLDEVASLAEAPVSSMPSGE